MYATASMMLPMSSKNKLKKYQNIWNKIADPKLVRLNEKYAKTVVRNQTIDVDTTESIMTTGRQTRYNRSGNPLPKNEKKKNK